MTVAANTGWGSATGTNITGPYSIPFPLYSQSHLQVIFVVNNVPSYPALGTDFTFTSWLPDLKGQVANPQITFTNLVAGGTLMVFRLAVPFTQLTSITNNYEFFPSLHESTFDVLDQTTIELCEWAGKTIKAPDWEQSGQTNLTLPPIAVRSNSYLGFDNSGNVTVYPGLPANPIEIEAQFPSTTTNNWNPTGLTDNTTMITLSATGAGTITGLKAPSTANYNQKITLFNNSAYTLTIDFSNTGSSAANRFINATSGNTSAVTATSAVDIIYSYQLGGWVVIN